MLASICIHRTPASPTMNSDGVPWALLASDRDGELKFAGTAILHPSHKERASWAKLMEALAMAKAAAEGPAPGLGSVASARAAGTGEASQGQGRAATCHCEAVRHGLARLG